MQFSLCKLCKSLYCLQMPMDKDYYSQIGREELSVCEDFKECNETETLSKLLTDYNKVCTK